jgi:outer membrane protein assembly factor BamD (BamD/ComL family)
MWRAALGLTMGASLSLAPFQCSRDPDPNMRREDTAGDALWALAQDFRAKHNEQAARDTLNYLVLKYPSSRYAPAAKEELGQGSDSAAP